MSMTEGTRFVPGSDVSAMSTAPPAVFLQGLTRVFHEGERSRRVLEALDLEVAAGECVALLGRSGSGKSTLLNLISGIDRPTCGTVRVHGTAVSDLSERERTRFRRRHVGFVYQFFNLLPTLSVAENVLLPLELNGASARRAGQRTRRMLEEVGLADRAHSYPDRLSGGEQQRVALARALVHEPSVVLADEPTGNLDADTGRVVLDLLDRLVRRRGHTLLLVTHSAEVAALADRRLVLSDGRLQTEALSE